MALFEYTLKFGYDYDEDEPAREDVFTANSYTYTDHGSLCFKMGDLVCREYFTHPETVIVRPAE